MYFLFSNNANKGVIIEEEIDSLTSLMEKYSIDSIEDGLHIT